MQLSIGKAGQCTEIQMWVIANVSVDALVRNTQFGDQERKIIAAVGELALQLRTETLDGQHGLLGGKLLVGRWRDVGHVGHGAGSVQTLLGRAFFGYDLRLDKRSNHGFGFSNRNQPWGALLSGVHNVVVLVRDLTLNQLLPRLVALVNDFAGVVLGLHLLTECKHVVRLAIGYLVCSEPRECCVNETGHQVIQIFHIINLTRHGVAHINHEHLPIHLALVDHTQHANDLDRLDLANRCDHGSHLAHIQWITITQSARLHMHLSRVLPRLREAPIVPNVSLVRIHIVHKPLLALLLILHYRAELVLGLELQLCICPPWNLHHHVIDPLFLIYEQGNIVQRIDWPKVLLLHEETHRVIHLARIHRLVLIHIGEFRRLYLCRLDTICFHCSHFDITFLISFLGYFLT
mmetsp:Transcript_22058/g.38083  ORF Transcript_22058/g.38083 Transcript_22058/m.38083 type:complete len:405 (-) Transcript_22058:305-1519(-)